MQEGKGDEEQEEKVKGVGKNSHSTCDDHGDDYETQTS